MDWIWVPGSNYWRKFVKQCLKLLLFSMPVSSDTLALRFLMLKSHARLLMLLGQLICFAFRSVRNLLFRIRFGGCLTMAVAAKHKVYKVN